MMREIKTIKKELTALKKRQEFLEDSLLTGQDSKALQKARAELAEGNTVSLAEMKKKLGL